MAQSFLGLWRIIPQLCKYDVGKAPVKATYHLVSSAQHQGTIDVTIGWTDHEGRDLSAKYQAELGVKKQDKYMSLDVLILHEIDEIGRFNSTIWQSPSEKLLMKSYREIKEEGKRLEVVMETPTQTGINRIFQVYEKDQ